MQIDPVEQRPGDPAAIPQYLVRRAATTPRVMPQISALARIHRGDELEARREIRLVRRTRDRDAARFERLAQHLEHRAVELRQLVEEEDAMVRERDLPRPRRRAAADERHGGGRVMRRAERTQPEELRTEHSFRDGLYRRGLDHLVHRNL